MRLPLGRLFAEERLEYVIVAAARVADLSANAALLALCLCQNNRQGSRNSGLT